MTRTLSQLGPGLAITSDIGASDHSVTNIVNRDYTDNIKNLSEGPGGDQDADNLYLKFEVFVLTSKGHVKYSDL